MSSVLVFNKENEITRCVCNPNVFGSITLAKARKIGKLKNISRGSSYRIYWKRYIYFLFLFFSLGGHAILQLLWRSCPLWYAPWLFSSIFEANYIITQKENGLISVWLVIFHILWMYCRLQTTYSIIALVLFFFWISHWTLSVTSNVKQRLKKINAQKKKKMVWHGRI